MHKGDAHLLALRNARLLDSAAVEDDLARVHGHNAGEYVHQRRFARAIFAQQGMNFALLNGQIHAFENRHAVKGLADAPHVQYTHSPHSVKKRAAAPALSRSATARSYSSDGNHPGR